MEQRINPLHSNQGRAASQRGRNPAGRSPVGQGTVSGQAARTVGSMDNYAVSRTPASIHVGDVFRGEITDLRNNEISITLEDNTVIRAKIPDSSNYSIGQTGSFRLTEISGNTLYLENISKNLTETELTLILKALDEANLPASPHNQEAVKALMDNLLPINRSSIQNLMQQAYDFKTEDMNTLAVMNRLMMKIDAESVAQFSNYRNDNYQLLERLQSFSRDIPALLSALSENGPADAVADFGKSLLSIGLSSQNDFAGSPAPTLASLPAQAQADIIQMLSGTALTEDAALQLENRTLTLQDTLTLLRDAALSGAIKQPEGMTDSEFASYLTQINEALETAEPQPAVTENYVRQILTLNETAPEAGADAGGDADIPLKDQAEPKPAGENQAEASAENAEKNQGRFAFAGKLLQSFSENAKNTISGTFGAVNAALKNASSQPEAQADVTFPNHSLDVLLRAYTNSARNHDFLNTFLSPGERSDLLNHLQDMPISRNLLLKIASGEATAREVLNVIHNTIPLSDSKQIKELFQSEVFNKLFSRELQSSWTLTPEQFKDSGLSDFYSKMQHQISQFRSLIQSTLSGSDSEQLGSFAKDIEDNLSFMKTLNDTFSFFQMPFKLPSQDAHGDLYVYTQKERLKQHPEKASVLLHLDLEHLGQIDIRIDKNRNDVITDFSLNDEESVNLFQVNANMLRDALEQQGYQCQLLFKQKKSPSPTVDDFINTRVNTHATTEMKRFSFDIRA